MHTPFWLQGLVDSKSLVQLSVNDGMILKDMLLGTSCVDTYLMHGKVHWRRRTLRFVPRMYHAIIKCWEKNARLNEI
jgi:hypothetical protein